MIVPPTGVRVLVATKPVDFRKGMDGLAAYIEQQLQADPFSGIVYVFRSKRADKVKLLFWDQTGLVLVTKRHRAARHGFRCWGSTAPAGPARRLVRLVAPVKAAG